MKCPYCEKEIVRIERYHSTVVWEKIGDKWEMDFHDEGTYFHLYCPDYDENSKSGKHECKRWRNELPDDLYRVIWGHERDSETVASKKKGGK